LSEAKVDVRYRRRNAPVSLSAMMHLLKKLFEEIGNSIS